MSADLCILFILGYCIPGLSCVLYIFQTSGMSAILPTLAESQAYAYFISWNIPGFPRMSAILHTTAYVLFLSRDIPEISQDFLGCAPSSTLQLSPRLMCPFYPGISQNFLGYPRASWDVMHSPHYSLCALFILGYLRLSQDFQGCMPSSTLQLSPRLVSFVSWDISGLPGMSTIHHTAVGSQAYVSFLSWDIPGLPGMSAILHTTKPGTPQQCGGWLTSQDILLGHYSMGLKGNGRIVYGDPRST